MPTTTESLRLQYSLFAIVSDIARRRRLDPLTRELPHAGDVSDLTAQVRSYAMRMPDDELTRLQHRLARAYLRELDDRLRAELAPPVPSDESAVIDEHVQRAVHAAGRSGDEVSVALVSMPWMAPAMPSIQLGTLAASLRGADISCDRHELFVDYAAVIGVELYKLIANTLPFTAEWLFARHYFGPEKGDYLLGFWDEHPRSGYFTGTVEEEVLDVLGPVTHQFLLDAIDSVDWGSYAVVGFSLTISQVASSLALARLIKRRHPQVTIVFGGAGCAGIMGRAILRVSPYVDAVVHVEGESVLPDLVRRVQAGQPLDGLAGVSARTTTPTGSSPSVGVELYRNRHDRPHIDYQPYFQRIARLGLTDRLQVWVPFEGSRGCWWGQKVQCAFCGLHEIMRFRDWKPADVLAELDHLYREHGLSRFFAVDLILPKEFHESLLPELASREERWTLFYEVKADMSRADAERLAAAGIRWIQPGIESLDHDLLRLIRKGTWPAHNIQLLRWSQELGIRASWNLLTGIPGATRAMYERMIGRIPLLFHLLAPSGCGDVQLHRFSPYFDEPEKYGVRYRGPHPLYRTVFPVAEDDLRDLVYLHEFEHVGGDPTGEIRAELEEVVEQWRAANRRGAVLDIAGSDEGHAVITDTRQSVAATTTVLDADEARLYRYLDTARARRSLAKEFAATEPDVFEALGGDRGVDRLVQRWCDAALVFEDRGRVLALAVDSVERAKWKATATDIPFL
ncbi:RiPP maturation radical SAM C-methyltransferase [Blastococcus sp. SYSU DS0541]